MKFLVIVAWMGVASLPMAAVRGEAATASHKGIRPSYVVCLTTPGDSVPDWFSCTAVEYKYQDARLNRAYKTFMAKLPVGGKEALRDSERKWIGARDQLCAIDGNDLDGRGLKSNDCALQLTARRAFDLEAERSGEVPASIDWKEALASFVGADRNVVAYQIGFLGERATPGVLMVIDGVSAADKASRRSVVLAAPDSSGKLVAIEENDRLIPCATCAGLRGDSWGFARIADGLFFLTAEGGARERWSSIYVFAYVPERKGWYLSEVRRGVADTAGAQGAQQRLTSKDFGVIRFEAFDPAKLPSFHLK